MNKERNVFLSFKDNTIKIPELDVDPSSSSGIRQWINTTDSMFRIRLIDNSIAEFYLTKKWPAGVSLLENDFEDPPPLETQHIEKLGDNQVVRYDFHPSVPHFELVRKAPSITSISAGPEHGLAIDDENRVWAWGNNDQGQLGQPGYQEDGNPLPISDAFFNKQFLNDAEQIIALENHSLIKRLDGSWWFSGQRIISDAQAIQGNGNVYCMMFPNVDFVLIKYINTGDILERGWVKRVLPTFADWSVLGLIQTHFDVNWHSYESAKEDGIFSLGDIVTGSVSSAYGTIAGGDLSATITVGAAHLSIKDRQGVFLEDDELYVGPVKRGDCDGFTFHHGTFILLGYDSDIAVISEDGENWSQVTLPVSGKWISCTNSRDYFIALSEEGYIIRTRDGVTWSLTTTLDYKQPEKTLEYSNQQIGESFNVGDSVTGEISRAVGEVVSITPNEAILDFDGIPLTRVLYFKDLEYARLHYNNIQSSGYKRLYYSNLQTSQNFSFNDSVTGETSNAIGSVVEVDRVNNFITFSNIVNSPFQNGERLIVGPNYIADANGYETDTLKFFSAGDVISGAISGSDAIVEYSYNFSETDGVLYLKFFTDAFQNGEPLLTENGHIASVDDSEGGAFDFVVGDFITGKVSAASAEIVESYSLGPIGWLTLQNIKGEFVDNEYLVRNNDGFEFVKADETLIDVPLFVEGSNLKGATSGAHGKITQTLHIGKLFTKGFYSDIILNYNNLQSGKSFSKGDIIYGETSRSTAEILSDESGYLYLYDVHGDFIDSERLIVDDIYIADVNGPINSSERSFSEGDHILGIISAATGIVDQVFSDHILLKEVHGDYEDNEHLVVNEQFIALVDGRLLVSSGQLSLISVSGVFIDDEHLEVKYVYTADANGDMGPLTGELTLGGVTGEFQNGERLLAPNYIADVEDELVDWPREVAWKSIVAKGDLVCTFASNSMIFGRSTDQGSSFIKSELPFHLDWSCAVGCWSVTESSVDPDDRYIILIAQQSREFLRSKDGVSWSMFSLSSGGGSLYFENLQYRDFGDSIKSETYLSDESVHAFAAIRKIIESVENPYNGILDIGIYRGTEDPLEWDYNGDNFLRNVRFVNEEGLYSYWLGSYQEVADVDGSMYDIKARLIVTGFTRGTGIIYHDGIEACIGYDNLQGGQEFFDGDIVTGETSGVQAEIHFVDSVNNNLYLINLFHPETRTFMESFEDNEKLTVDGVYIADANGDMSRDIFNLNETIIQCREDGHQVYIWDHENRERLEFRSVSNVNLVSLKDQKIRGKSSGAVAVVKETWISSNYGSAVLTYQNLKDDFAILHFDYLDYGEYFNIDDIVTGQTSGASATIRSFNEIEKVIAVDSISGDFVYGEKLVVDGTVIAKSDSILKYGFQEGIKVTGQDSGSLAEIFRNVEDSETSGELQLIYNRGCFDWSESVGEHLAVGGIPGLYVADSTIQRIRDARGIFVIEQRIGSFVQDEEIVVVSSDTGEDEYSLGTVERLSKGSFGILFYDEAPYLYPNPGLTTTKYVKYKNLQPGKMFSIGQEVQGGTSGMIGTIVAVSTYAQTIVISSDSYDELFFDDNEWLVVSSQNYAQANGDAVNWMGNVLKYSNLQPGKSFSVGDVVTGSTSNVKVSIDDVINSDHLNGGILLLNDFRDFIESEQMLVSGQYVANIHKEEQDYSSPFWSRGVQLLIKGSPVGTNPDIPFCKPLVKGPVHFPVFSLYDKVVGETSGSQGVILQGDYIQNVVDPLFEIGENLLVDGKIRCNFALYDWVSGKLRFKNKKGREFFASDVITGSFSGSTALIENVGDFDNPVNLKEGYQYYYDLQEIGRFNYTNLQEGKSFNENDWVFGETSKTIAQVKYVHDFNNIQFLIISDFVRDHVVYENLQSGKIFNEGDVVIGEDSGSKAIASLVFSEYDIIGLSCFYGVFQEGERLLVNGLYIADFSTFHSGVDFISSERILVSSEYIADSYSLVQYGFNSGDCIEAESSLTDWGQYSSFAKFLDHTILFSDYYIHDEPGESFGPEAELLYSDMVIGDTFKRRQVIYGSWSGAFGTISKNYPSVGYIHYSDLDTGYSFNVGDNIVCSISGAKGIILKDTPYAKLEYSNLQGDPEDSPDVIFSELDIVTGKISGARGEVATLVEVPSFNKLGYKDLQSFNGNYLGLGCYAYNNISSTVKDLLTGGVYFDIVRMIPNTDTEGIFYLKDQPNETIPDNYYIFIIDGTKNKYTRRIAQVNGDSIYAPEKGYLYLKDVEGSFQNGEELRVLKDAILFDNIQPGKIIYPRDLISGGTSGATATIIQVEDDVLFLKDIWGTFENSEQLLVKDHRFPNSLFDYCADTNSVIFTGNLYTADSSSLPVTGNSGCLELGNIELGTTVEYSRRIEDSDQDFITGDCLIGKISGVTAKIDKIVPYSFMGCKNIGLIYKFNEKDFISGELSGATAIVNSIYDDPHDQQRATLKLTDVDGIFTDNEEIIVNNIPIATVDKGISSNLLFRQMVGAKIRYTDKVRSKTFVVGTTYYDLHSGAQGTVLYKESISSTEGFLIVDGLIGIFRGPIVDISLQLFANTSSMDWCFDIGDSIVGKTSGTTATVNCRSTDWSHSGIVCGLYNFYNATPNSLIRFIDQEKNSGFEYAPGFFNITEDGIINGLDYYTTITGLTNVHLIRSGVVGNYFGSDRNWEISNPEIWGKNEDEEYECSFSVKTGLLGVTDISGPGFQDGEIIQVHGIDLALVDGALRMPAGHLVLSQLESYKKNDGFEFAEWLNLIRIGYSTLQSGKSFSPGDTIQGFNSLATATVNSVYPQDLYRGYLNISSLKGQFQPSEPIYVNDELHAYTFGSSYESSVAASASEIDLDNDFFHGESININNDCKAKVLNKSQFHKGKLHLRECKGSFLQDEPLTSDVGILTFDNYQGTPFRIGSSIYGFSSHSIAKIFKIDLNVAQKTGRLHLREIMGPFIDGEEIHSQGIFKGNINGIVDYVDRADVADVDNRYFRYTSGTMHCQDFAGFVDEEFRPDWLLVYGVRFAKISDDPDFYLGLRLDLINISGEFQDQEWLEVDGVFIASAKRFIHNVEFETHRGTLSYTGTAVQSNDNYDTQDWVNIEYSSNRGCALISNRSDCNYGNLKIYRTQANRRFFKGDLIEGEESATVAEVLGYYDDDAIIVRMISDTDFIARERLLVNNDYIASIYDAILTPVYTNGPANKILIDESNDGSDWSSVTVSAALYTSVSFLDFESYDYLTCTSDESDYDAIIPHPMDWMPGVNPSLPVASQGWPYFTNLVDFKHMDTLDLDVALTPTGTVSLRGARVAGWVDLAHDGSSFVAIGYNSDQVVVGYYEAVVETKHELKLLDRAPGQWLEINDVVVGRESLAVGTVETDPYDKDESQDHYDWVDLRFGSVTGVFETGEKISVDGVIYGAVGHYRTYPNYQKLTDYSISYHSLPSTAEWISIDWNGSVYCAVARNSNKAATSSDGASWTARTLPSVLDWTKIIVHGTIFVAFAYNTNIFAYSDDDGTTWSLGTLPIVGKWSAAASSNSTLVVFSENSTSVIRTIDLINWTVHTLPFVGFWSDVIWNDSVFCVIALDDPYVVVSSNGSSWTKGGSLRYVDGASSITSYNGNFFVEYFISTDDGQSWDLAKETWGDTNSLGVSILGCYPRIVDPDDKKNSITFLDFYGTVYTASIYEYTNYSSVELSWRSVTNLQNLSESSNEWEDLGVTGITGIAVGDEHFLLLRNDGGVLAWGDNEKGQLGTNRFDDSILLTEVEALSHVNIEKIFCYDYRSFAIEDNGKVWGWGNNNTGGLGIRPSLWPIRSPREISLLEDAVIIEEDFVVKEDHSIWSISKRQQVWSFIDGCINISQGNDYSIVLDNEKTMWSYGENENGKLGIGREEEFELTIPWQTFGSKTTVDYICPRYSAFVLANGEVWSEDYFIYRGTDVVEVMPYYRSGSLMLKDDGTVWCKTYGDGLLENNGALLFGEDGKGVAFNSMNDSFSLIDIPDNYKGTASLLNVQIMVTSGVTNKIKVSRDGKYWDEVELPTSGEWVIGMRPTTEKLYHYDYDPYYGYEGASFPSIVVCENYNLRGQANGPFVLMARGQSTVLHSVDGYKWDWYYIQHTDNWKVVKQFVETASAEYIHEAGNPSTPTNYWNFVLRNRWIALVDGDVNYFYESFDLKNWTKRYFPFSDIWQDVAFVRSFNVAKRKEYTDAISAPDSLTDWLSIIVEDRGRYIFLPKETDKITYFETKVLGFESGTKCPVYGDAADECRLQYFGEFESAVGYDSIDEDFFYQKDLPTRPVDSFWKTISASTAETWYSTYETIVAAIPSLGNKVVISRNGNTDYIECTLPITATEWDGVWFFPSNSVPDQGQLKIGDESVVILYYKDLPTGKHWDDTDVLWDADSFQCLYEGAILKCVDSNDVYNEERAVWYDPGELEKYHYGDFDNPNYDFCEYTFVCNNTSLLWENPLDLTKGFIAGGLNINFTYPTKLERYFSIDVDTDLYAWYSIWNPLPLPGYYSRAVWFSCKADSPILKTWATFIIISTKDKKAYTSNADMWPTGYPTLDSWTEYDLPDGVQSYSYSDLSRFPDIGIFSILQNQTLQERQLTEFSNVNQLSFIRGGETVLYDDDRSHIPMVLKDDGTIWYWRPFDSTPKQLSGITGVIQLGGPERQELINVEADVTLHQATYYFRYKNKQPSTDWTPGGIYGMQCYGETSGASFTIQGEYNEDIESGYVSFNYLGSEIDLIPGEKIRRYGVGTYIADVVGTQDNVFKINGRISQVGTATTIYAKISQVIDDTHITLEWLRELRGEALGLWSGNHPYDYLTVYLPSKDFSLRTASAPVEEETVRYFRDRYYALKSDGTIWSWTMDRGTYDVVNTPSQCAVVSDAVELFVGPPNVFIKSDRTLWYFRGNDSIGEYVSKIPNLPLIKSVAVGGSAFEWLTDRWRTGYEEPRVQGYALDYEGNVYKFKDFFNYTESFTDDWDEFPNFFAKLNSINFARDITQITNVEDYWYYWLEDGKVNYFQYEETESHYYASDLCDYRYYYPRGELIFTLDLYQVGTIDSAALWITDRTGYAANTEIFIKLSHDKGKTWSPWESYTSGDYITTLVTGMDVHNTLMQVKVVAAIDPLNWSVSPFITEFLFQIDSEG